MPGFIPWLSLHFLAAAAGTWLAARPSMPSMKFQTLTRTRTATMAKSACQTGAPWRYRAAANTSADNR